jgi:hypothetical protein
VSGLASKPLGRFSPVWPQNRWRQFSPVWPQNRLLGFPGLGLEIGSSGLVIWASKSPRWFLGLCLKTMLASVCRLCLKTNGGRTARDTHRDQASHARVSQSGVKTGRGAAAGGACGTIMDVASGLS